MSMSIDQVERLLGVAREISEGLCDLLNALHRERPVEFERVYDEASGLMDHIEDLCDEKNVKR